MSEGDRGRVDQVELRLTYAELAIVRRSLEAARTLETTFEQRDQPLEDVLEVVDRTLDAAL